MYKVERWRRQELALLLDELVLTLRSGKNPEWAGVFAHFGHELALLGSARAVDERQLQRLVGCIELCLEPGHGFSRLLQRSPLAAAFPKTLAVLSFHQPDESFLDGLVFRAEADFGERVKTAQDIGIPEGIADVLPVGGEGPVFVDFVAEKAAQQLFPCLPRLFAALPGRRLGECSEDHAGDMMGKRL